MSEREKYFTETVLPNVFALERFGKRKKFISCKKSDNDVTGDQFASSIVFVTVLVKDSDAEKEKEIKVVIKYQPHSVKVQELMNSSAQFRNENTMYTDILPFLEFNNTVSSLFPKFYYGECYNNGINNEPVIVLEDLRSKSYELSKLRLFLDFDHVVLALKELGKFHAMSYIAKQKHPKQFNEITNKFIEPIWDRNDNIILKSTIGPCALRGINALYSTKKSDFLKRMKEIVEEDTVGLMKYFVKPEEPLSVICHGDFCNHNILFKYDNGLPTSVNFFDLQASRYASPVIDISMILLLNTEYKLRSLYWNDFLKVYYDSMAQTVKNAECVPPTFDQLLCELKNKCFYGYFHCSYFLPMVTCVNGVPDINQTAKMEIAEFIELYKNYNGERGTQYLIDVVKHLEELEYLPSY